MQAMLQQHNLKQRQLFEQQFHQQQQQKLGSPQMVSSPQLMQAPSPQLSQQMSPQTDQTFTAMQNLQKVILSPMVTLTTSLKDSLFAPVLAPTRLVLSGMEPQSTSKLGWIISLLGQDVHSREDVL